MDCRRGALSAGLKMPDGGDAYPACENNVKPGQRSATGHKQHYSLSPSRTDSSAILIMSLKVV